MTSARFFSVERVSGTWKTKELDANERDIFEVLCICISDRDATKFSAIQNASQSWRLYLNKTVLVSATGQEFGSDRNVALTPCHLAAISHAEVILKELIRSGGDLSKQCIEITETHGKKKFTLKETVFELILCYFREPMTFIRTLLDESIECNDLGSSYEYTFNFTILQPTMQVTSQRILEEAICGHQMTVLNSILNSTDNIHSEQYELLKHPLIVAYLTCKWKHYRRFFFLLVLLHLSFVLCLSSAVILTVKSFQWFHNHSVVTLITRNFSIANEKDDHNNIVNVADSFDLTMRSIRLLDSLALICGIFLLIHAIIQAHFIPLKKLLTEFEIILNLLTAPFAVLKCIFVISMPYDWFFDGQNRWIYHLSSFIILPAWINLMLIVGRFPRLGCYSLMFTTVLQNFLKVMTSFVFLIIGFALSFSLMFPSSEFFNNPAQALLRSIVMMVGEFDYVSTFSAEEDQFLSGTSRVIFLFFIISCSIILMNLTQGIAVNDIKLLHEISQIVRLEKETRFLFELECVFTHSMIVSHPFLRKIKKRLYDRGVTTDVMTVTRDNREGLSKEVYEKLVQEFKPFKCTWNRRMSFIRCIPNK